MVKLKLWLDAFVCGYMRQILAFGFSLVTLKFSVDDFFLKIFDSELQYERYYFEPFCLPAEMAARTVIRFILPVQITN